MAQEVSPTDIHTSADVNKAILEVACAAYFEGRPRIFLSRNIDDVHPTLAKFGAEAIYASASDLSDDGYVRIHDFKVTFPADGGEPLVMLGSRPSISITSLGVSYWETISSER